jgi:hypothetical protein
MQSEEPDEANLQSGLPGTRRGHKCLTGFIAFHVPATGPRRADAFGPVRNPFLVRSQITNCTHRRVSPMQALTASARCLK